MGQSVVNDNMASYPYEEAQNINDNMSSVISPLSHSFTCKQIYGENANLDLHDN
jgi:hypothetical protein